MTLADGRYILFGGQVYYPTGGWHDFIGRYDTLDGARAQATSLLYGVWSEVQWATIVDLDTNEIVDRLGRPGYGQPDWDPDG